MGHSKNAFPTAGNNQVRHIKSYRHRTFLFWLLVATATVTLVTVLVSTCSSEDLDANTAETREKTLSRNYPPLQAPEVRHVSAPISAVVPDHNIDHLFFKESTADGLYIKVAVARRCKSGIDKPIPQICQTLPEVSANELTQMRLNAANAGSHQARIELLLEQFNAALKSANRQDKLVAGSADIGALRSTLEELRLETFKFGDSAELHNLSTAYLLASDLLPEAGITAAALALLGEQRSATSRSNVDAELLEHNSETSADIIRIFRQFAKELLLSSSS